MADQNFWRNIKGAFGGQPPASRTTTFESLCDAGLHQVDPNWKKQGKECPYCKALTASHRTQESAKASAEAPAPPSGKRRSTFAEDGGGAGHDSAKQEPNQGASMAAEGTSRRYTKVDSGAIDAASVSGRLSGGNRRIQGILSTFTWNPNGDLYMLRDGRNFVGSGTVGSENNAPCDAQVPTDSRMSSAHLLILFQAGRPLISDNMSTNGTLVNGTLIDGRGVELVDGAEIKAGDTVFVYQRIKRTDSGPARPPHPKPTPEDPPNGNKGGPHRNPTIVN